MRVVPANVKTVIGSLSSSDENREQQKSNRFRACLHGGRGPQIGEVTCGRSPHGTCHVNVIKLKWGIIWTGGLPHLPAVPHTSM